jgi:WD40 repeat protein
MVRDPFDLDDDDGDPGRLDRERSIRDFERAWHDGRRPAIEDFLGGDRAANRALLVELALADLEFRLKAGEPAQAREYLDRYPELGRDRVIARDLYQAERAFRRAARVPDAGAQFGTHDPEAGALPRRLGRFELRDIAGEGTFGVVYRAIDGELGREVAVKILRRSFTKAVGGTRRFVREARSAARLRHPGIVAVHELGQSGGVCYLVSEFIPGQTLEERLRAAAFPPREAAGLLIHIARAIDHAHREGVVHRDLKPSNILLDEQGRPHVADFGLAKELAAETLTCEGDLLGTPAYMAPETASGRAARADARADIYSLGVILYELLAGTLPFRGSPRALLHQIVHDEPRPPSSLHDQVPRDLETICLKAMAREPDRRYRSAAALADDLQRYLDGRPILARPTPAWERGLLWARRRPAVAALVLLVWLVATAAVGGILWQWRRASLARDRAEQTARAERASRERLQNLLYYHTIALSERELAAGNLGRAEQLLRQCDPAQRGWEWRYLRRRQVEPPARLEGPSGFVHAIAFSGDSRRLASGGEDLLIRLWDVASRRLIWSATGHSGPIHQLAFQPRGGLLLSAGDRTVRLWDARTGAAVRTLEGHHGLVWSAVFSPDGRLIASAGDDQVVRVWDAATGRPLRVLEGHTDRIHRVAFSPDGRLIASASSDGSLRLFDLAAGRLVRRFQTAPLSVCQSLVFGPDGRWIAAAHGSRVIVWDRGSGEPIATFSGHTAAVFDLSLSLPENRLVTAAGDGALKLWDLRTGQEILTLRGHECDYVRTVAFSPDGAFVASGDRLGGLLLWDGSTLDAPRDPASRVLVRRGQAVRDIEFAPDGRTIATAGGSNTVELWDAKTGARLLATGGQQWPVGRIAFCPDGHAIATAGRDGMVRIWDSRSGKLARTIPAHDRAVTDVAFSPDGQWIATSGMDYTVRLWNARDGSLARAFSPHGTYWAHRLTFSPDSRLLATVGGETTVRVWEVGSGREYRALRGHELEVWSVAFCPDSRHLATGSSDQSVRVWDLAAGEALHVLRGHAKLVEGLAFSPDGAMLATASRDCATRLWNVASGEMVQELRGHLGEVYCVAFHPRSARPLLAFGGQDGTVRVWGPPPSTPPLAGIPP